MKIKMDSHRVLILLLLAIPAVLFVGRCVADSGAGSLADDEDLRFLESVLDAEDSGVEKVQLGVDHGDLEGGDGEKYDGEEPELEPEVDESDVVVLTGGNFTDFVDSHGNVLVEFYAPWCGHCRSLKPEYAAAATELRGEEGVALAKVDATEETDLAQKYDVQGYPTILFFINGVPREYSGGRTREGIVNWITKRLGPGVYNITTVQEAKKILDSESKFVVGYLNSLVGTEAAELSAAAKLEDELKFYQTDDAEIAKAFEIDPDRKPPSLVLLKREEEKLTNFDGPFVKSSIAEFVIANKLPLVIPLTQETAQAIFGSSIKKQILLFTRPKDSGVFLDYIKAAAKLFKGKLLFVHVDLEHPDIGEQLLSYFGLTGEEPKVLAFSGNEEQKKYILDGEITPSSIKKFIEDYLEDKVEPYYKSDPVPENNLDDVKIVVGKSFEEIVLDESKDVLLEIYAPWCMHCQALEPIYNKLGKHLRGINSLVIAKMDGTTNEHPRATADGFPTLLFYPAGNKSFEPITVDADRTVVGLYKFIKQHASIPFKLQRLEPTKKAEKTEATLEASSVIEGESYGTNVKDEL